MVVQSAKVVFRIYCRLMGIWLQKKTAALGGLHNSFADHASLFRKQLILVLLKCGCGLKLDNDCFVEELAAD